MIMIHPSAIISPKAHIGNNVKIAPHAIIEDDAVIGDNCEIGYHAVVGEGTELGNNVVMFPGAVVGLAPQDLKYKGEKTKTFIGESTVLREYSTIHRGTVETGRTTVGKNCLIMAYSHVAHDCHVGDNVIMSNATQLAGHVQVGDWTIFGGVVKVVQFSKIGKHCMLGAGVKIVKDVCHYALMGKIPAKVEGINKVGLRRRGFSIHTIAEIEKFYDNIIFSGMNISDGMDQYLSEHPDLMEEIRECVDFIKNSTRGIHR